MEYTVDLIICLAIWTLPKRRAPLISDDLLVGCVASRKRVRFTLRLELIFEDFGGPSGTRNSIFEQFFQFFFEYLFASNFDRFLEDPNQKNPPRCSQRLAC